MFGRLLSTTCQHLSNRFRTARRRKFRRLSCDHLETRNLLAAADFDLYRNEDVSPAGGTIGTGTPFNNNLNSQIASVGDTMIASGVEYAAISEDNGGVWQPLDPNSVFTQQPGLTNRWDDAGYSGVSRLATDPIRGMVMWLGHYDPRIPTDDKGNPIFEQAENGLRLVVARTEQDLIDGNWITYDFSMYQLGQVRGVYAVNPQMQVSNNFLYMEVDFVKAEDTDEGRIEFYAGSAWWRVSLDSLQAGGDINRNQIFRTTQAPIGLVNGAKDVMYGAANTGSNKILVYRWADADTGPRALPANPGGDFTRSGLNFTTSDFAITSYVQEDDDLPPIVNKVQTGWVGNGQVGFMWNSNARLLDGKPNPFIRTVVFDEQILNSPTGDPLISQPDVYTNSESFFYPTAAVNARGHVAVMVGRATGAGPVANDILIDDAFNGAPTAGDGWERYEAAIGTKTTDPTFPEFINAGRYYGIMADDDFSNTWIAGGWIDEDLAPDVPRFYWFGREQDRPQANLRGDGFDVVQDTAGPGETIDIQYQVVNEGITDAGPFTVSFYASSHPFIGSNDVLLGTATIAGGLAAGANTGLQTITLAMPAASDPFWSELPGLGYTIGMIIDRSRVVPEYDESDNSNLGVGIDSANMFPLDYADNDTLANAADLGFLSGLREYESFSVSPTGDRDWYKVTAPFDGTLRVRIDYAAADGDVNLSLHSSSGAFLTASPSPGDFEQVTIPVTAGVDYYIQVQGAVGESNSYILTTEYQIQPRDSFELNANGQRNNSLQTPRDLGVAPFFSETNLNIAEYNDEDYYVFTALRSGPFTGKINYDNRYGNLDLYIYRQNGALLDSSTGKGNSDTVTAQLEVNQRYFIRVTGRGLDTNSYRLEYEAPAPPVYRDGNTIYVTGTDQNDTLIFVPESPDFSTNQVIVNEIAFNVPASASKLVFRGGAGVNTVIVNGTSRADNISGFVAAARMNSYTMSLEDIQRLTLQGNGGNDIIRGVGQRAITAIGGDDNDTITGGLLNDVLRGGPGNDTLDGSDGNDRIIGEQGNDRLTDGAGDDELAGGSGDDTYFFTEPVAAQTDRILEQVSGGVDTLDFSLSTSTVTVDLASDLQMARQGFRTVRTDAAGQASNLENIVGSAGNDTLRGNSGNNLIRGGEGNDLLEGRTGDDTYAFDNPNSAQTDTIRELGNQGIDTLSFSTSTLQVAVDLASDSATAQQGTRTVIMQAAGQSSHMENAIGGFADDILLGNARANTLEGGEGSDTLDARGGNDVYFFRNAIQPQTDTVIEVVSQGRDTLDFSGLTNPTVGVTVDLRATGNQIASHSGRIVNVGAAGQAKYFENITGGAGNDLFIGSGAKNTLMGGSGRDILVGGRGADILDGGIGDDLLIAGSVRFNLQQMQTVQAEWVRTDFGYFGRVSHLRGPNGGLNNVNFLDLDSVFDDDAIDDLLGGADQDYFFVSANDTSDVDVDPFVDEEFN